MATPPAELQDIRDAVTDYYIACSLFALMVYEYITTFDQEVAVVWGRKFSATSVLLLGSRWLMVVFAYLVFYPGPANCRDEFTALGAIFITVLIVVPLFSALRVYAIWKASSWSYVFFFSTLLLGLAPVGANVFGWVRTEISYVDVPVLQSQCVYSINVSQTHRQELLYITRGSAITSDLLVLVLTWAKTFGHFREMQRLNIGSSVSSILIKNGTIYFIALLCINILQLVTYSSNAVSNYAENYLQLLPLLLIERFMLNLRRLSPGSSTGYSESHPTALSSVDFRAPSGLFGDLGEPLEHGQSLDVDEGGGGDASTGAAEDDLEYSLQDAEAGRNGVASPVEADDAA